MLRDLVIETKEVKIGNASFSVHGITMEDLADLLGDYTTELGLLFDGKLPMERLVIEVPLLASKIIALAADEPDQINKVRKMSFASQLETMEAIWDLTVPDDEKLGKLLDRLTGMLEVRKLPAALESESRDKEKPTTGKSKSPKPSKGSSQTVTAGAS